MISDPRVRRADALTQVIRFAEHVAFPRTEETQEELIRAFQQASKDVQHAQQIGDYLMRNGVPRGFDRGLDTSVCPTPGDVWAASLIVRPYVIPEWIMREPVCKECGDSGFRTEKRGDYDFAVRCKRCTVAA